MSEIIEIIGNAMRTDADALRVIGQNIANAGVTAYRRQIPMAAAGFERMLGGAASATADPQTVVRSIDGNVAIDLRPGSLKSTGAPLDVALEGSGFFVLQSVAGPVLTRRGDFHVSAEGTLTAASGEAVLGDNGAIHIGVGTPAIETDGTIRIGKDIVDRLRVVQVANDADLRHLGNGLYASSSGALADSEVYPVVRQGFLETSNVTPVSEMVQLMETMRHFEGAQRFVHAHDRMLEKAISELGKVG